MANAKTDPRNEVLIRLNLQEAGAIERCLRTEDALTQEPTERVRCIYFGRAAPRTLADADHNEHQVHARVWERSSKPDEVLLEVQRALADELRQTRIALPRKALRAAMRANALQELSPGLPHDLVPTLGVEFTRRAWTHPEGWWASMDKEISFHRLHPRALERTGQLVLGIPDRCLDGAVGLTVARTEAELPDWLEMLLSASDSWDLFREGLPLTAPRPSGASVAPGLRIVLQ